jgi:hypothetical protein
VSKEVAAAILTQTYFQSIPKAAAYLIKEVESGKTKGTSPESGATSALVLTYKQILSRSSKRLKRGGQTTMTEKSMVSNDRKTRTCQ